MLAKEFNPEFNPEYYLAPYYFHNITKEEEEDDEEEGGGGLPRPCYSYAVRIVRCSVEGSLAVGSGCESPIPGASHFRGIPIC